MRLPEVNPPGCKHKHCCDCKHPDAHVMELFPNVLSIKKAQVHGNKVPDEASDQRGWQEAMVRHAQNAHRVGDYSPYRKHQTPQYNCCRTEPLDPSLADLQSVWSDKDVASKPLYQPFSAKEANTIGNGGSD